ncbi:PGR5-like protein 1A [Nymphaea thermarum]|nr:PGR5-like protein 1A [Nymphaea thermarum]
MAIEFGFPAAAARIFSSLPSRLSCSPLCYRRFPPPSSSFSLPSSPIRIPFPNHGKFNLSVSATRRSLCVAAQSAEQQGQVEENEVVDSKILPYCSLDKKAEKKTLGELEQEFLQALQSFYYDKEPIMSNEEFDNLKEELMWEGSSVVMLNPDEQKLLEASMAYVAGKPIMSDEEFDALKLRLKVYSDLQVDYFKMFLLNVPAAVISLTLFFFLDDLTGFEITYLLELPEPFSFIFTWFAALPLIFWGAQGITNAIVKDFLILKGPCPNCGTENTSFFGTILTVPSGGSANTIKCSNCGTALVYDSGSRLITVDNDIDKLRYM